MKATSLDHERDLKKKDSEVHITCSIKLSLFHYLTILLLSLSLLYLPHRER